VTFYSLMSELEGLGALGEKAPVTSKASPPVTNPGEFVELCETALEALASIGEAQTTLLRVFAQLRQMAVEAPRSEEAVVRDIYDPFEAPGSDATEWMLDSSGDTGSETLSPEAPASLPENSHDEEVREES